jgi:glycogen synthase
MPPRTRVLVLTSMYPPHHYGGYEHSCQDVVTELRRRGHDVRVLTTTHRRPGVPDPQDEPAAGGVFRRLEWYWQDHVILRPSARQALATERANQAVLLEHLEDFRPDVVSVWAMGAMSFGLLTTLAERQVPVLAYVCDEWPVYGPHVDGWARRFLGRRRRAAIARQLAGVPTAVPDLGPQFTWCFVSDTMRRVAQEKAAFDFGDTTVVWSGIDTDDFPLPTGPVRAKPWEWRLLYVGRIDPRKGIDTAIQALPLLDPNASLEVLGHGEASELARLRALAATLGVGERVHFGAAARSELRQHYADADVAVFPSRWREPFGLVPIEAMTCDTPVVATGTGGTGEFLADGVNALLHRPGDHEGLAAAVQRLAADPAVRKRLATAGRVTAAELTNDRLVDVLEAWHVAVASEFREGRPPDRPPPVAATV